MVRLFILFLIALLPLRGWTAERMELQMGHGVLVVALSQATDNVMSADCALHMQTTSGGQASLHGSDHKVCESCQLCMPLAALHAAEVLTPACEPQVLPATGNSRFVSADPSQGVKPPIS